MNEPAPLTRHGTPRSASRPRPHGFTLMEVIFALLLVGLVYVAALNTLGAARANQLRTHDHAVAYMLAQGRMSELLAEPYDELASESKRELPDRVGWYQAVAVEHVAVDEPDRATDHATGLRRVSVTIYRGNAVLAELVALRTRGTPALATSVEAIRP